jgi:N-acyl-phosphatidylethanolamine-hydrolysing phospholipase D
MAVDDLSPIDFVAIFHNHYDYLDLPTLRALAKRNADTKFFVPLGNGELILRQGITLVQGLDWEQSGTRCPDYSHPSINVQPEFT